MITFKEFVAEGDVIQGKFKKLDKPEPKKLSLIDAFGSDELKIIHHAGIKFAEKPDYFEYVRSDYAITPIQLQNLKKEFKKHGFTLNEFDAKDIFVRLRTDDNKTGGTSADIKPGIQDTAFIVKFESGNRYLVDRTGAKSYIRMWVFIKDK